MVYHTPKQNTLQRYRIYLLWANILNKIINRKLKFFLFFDFRLIFEWGIKNFYMVNGQRSLFFVGEVFAFSVICVVGTNDYVFLILLLRGRSSRASLHLHWGVHTVSWYCFWLFASFGREQSASLSKNTHSRCVFLRSLLDCLLACRLFEGCCWVEI